MGPVQPLLEILQRAERRLAQARIDAPHREAARAWVIRYANDLPNQPRSFEVLEEARLGREILGAPSAEQRAVRGLALAVLAERRFQDLELEIQDGLTVLAHGLLESGVATDASDVEWTVSQLDAVFAPFSSGWVERHLSLKQMIAAMCTGIVRSPLGGEALPEDTRERLLAFEQKVTSSAFAEPTTTKALQALLERPDAAPRDGKAPGNPRRPRAKKLAPAATDAAEPPELGRVVAHLAGKAWWMARSPDPDAVVAALGLASPVAVTWDQLSDKSFDRSARVAVLPPIDGWTLVCGWPELRFSDPWALGRTRERLATLSDRFGAAYGFMNNDTLREHGFVLAQDGRTERVDVVSRTTQFAYETGARSEHEPESYESSGTRIRTIAAAVGLSPQDLGEELDVEGAPVAGILPATLGLTLGIEA